MADLGLNHQAASINKVVKNCSGTNFLGSDSGSNIYGFRQVTSSLHLRFLIYEMGMMIDSTSYCLNFLYGLNEVMYCRYLTNTRVAQSISRSQNWISGIARNRLLKLQDTAGQTALSII